MKKILVTALLTLIVLGTAAGNTETYLIFRERITYNEPRLSILARAVNGSIGSFILSNELFTPPYFLIELNERNFNNFREALGIFLEWEMMAIENNLDSFTRAIPVIVESNNVTWSWTNIWSFRNSNTMIINFMFDWNPSRRREFRALLNISSNFIEPRERGPQFVFRKNFMNNEEVTLFLDDITDEKIDLVVLENREMILESERQRLLIEELFR